VQACSCYSKSIQRPAIPSRHSGSAQGVRPPTSGASGDICARPRRTPGIRKDSSEGCDCLGEGCDCASAGAAICTSLVASQLKVCQKRTRKGGIYDVERSFRSNAVRFMRRQGLTAAAASPFIEHDTQAASRTWRASPLRHVSGRLPHMGSQVFRPRRAAFLQGQVSNDTARVSRCAGARRVFDPARAGAGILHSCLTRAHPRDITARAGRLRPGTAAQVRVARESQDRGCQYADGSRGYSRQCALAAGAIPAPDMTGYVERDGIGRARAPGRIAAFRSRALLAGRR